jgi:hypothetical protein
MSTPTPVESFLGGVGLTLPVHSLLILNGTVFGVSGFIHRTMRGSLESAASAMGLILGGIAVGLVEGKGNRPEVIGGGLQTVLVSGFLVGVGTKVRSMIAPHI